MYTLTLNFYGVVLRIFSDSLEQVKWLEAQHRLFVVPDNVKPTAEIQCGEEFISEPLAQHGMFILHAAAFRNISVLGILVVGVSGSGKSTIAFSALSCGYPYVSDEKVLCRQDEHGVCLLPFANLIGLNWGSEVKQFYDVLQYHAKDIFCQVLTNVVVLPHITADRSSTLEKVTDKRTVLHILLQNIIWVGDKALREKQVQLLNKLCELPAYVLLLGEDHKNRQQVALDLLNGI